MLDDDAGSAGKRELEAAIETVSKQETDIKGRNV